MKTAEEILSSYVSCLNNYAQKDNMIKAMQEHTSQQLAERDETLKKRGVKIIEDAVKILTLEHQIKGHQSEIQSLKEEVEGLKAQNHTLGSLIESREREITTQAEEIKKLKEVIQDLVKWEETNFIEEDLLVRLKSLLTPKKEESKEGESNG